MIRTYAENLKELFDSGLVKVSKVELYNFRSTESREISITDFMNDFRLFSKSEIFRNSVAWKFDIFYDMVTKSNMIVQAEIGETEEITIHIVFNKENIAKEVNEILLKWMGSEE